MEQTYEIRAGKEMEGRRLDRLLSDTLADYTRSFLQKLIKQGQVSVDGQPVKANYIVSPGDVISVVIPEPEELSIEPEPLPLEIVYEDEDLLIVNKPKGMVVHPAPGHSSGTLVNGLLYHCHGRLSGINGILRPGIVHRIDRDTTGLLVVCKNDFAHHFLAEQLKVHSITRKYHGIVMGNMKEDSGTVQGTIGRHPSDRKRMAVNVRNGKTAVTHYRVLKRLKNNSYTYVECELETGRTHQIRVHMASIHHPLLGDMVYGPAKQPYALEGQCLHAKTLGFIHPRTGKYMEFDSELPAYFENLLEKLC